MNSSIHYSLIFPLVVLFALVSAILFFALIDRLYKSKAIGDKFKRLQLRYDLAIQGSNAGIYEWDLSTNKIMHNNMVSVILGYENNELRELSLESFIERVHPDDREMVSSAVTLHLQGIAPYSTEFRMLRKDGSYIWVNDTGLALRDEGGTPILWAGWLNNITQRKLYEQEILSKNEELKRLNNNLDLILYKISHDLKAPLHSIRGLAYIGKTSLNSSIDCFGQIEERVSYLTNYINEFIESVRVSKAEVKYDAINLAELVNEVVKSILPDNSGILVRIRINHELKVISDPTRLRTIISNLLSNSIKYRDTNKVVSTIDIVCIVGNSSWRLLVEDNGIGIPEDHISKIFDMFHRATTNKPGSGLGLYIVKQSVEQLNGDITVNSELGLGTSICLQLPNVSTARV